MPTSLFLQEMTPGSSGPSTVQLERLVIQAICQGTPEGPVVETAKTLLKGYPWREPLHQAIFDSLLKISQSAPEAIRAELPVRLTRRGFPDVAWQDFFQPHSLSKQEVEALIRQLHDLV